MPISIQCRDHHLEQTKSVRNQFTIGCFFFLHQQSADHIAHISAQIIVCNRVHNKVCRIFHRNLVGRFQYYKLYNVNVRDDTTDREL